MQIAFFKMRVFAEIKTEHQQKGFQMKKNRPNCVAAGNDIFNMKSLGKDISSLSCQAIGEILQRTQNFMRKNGFVKEYGDWFEFSMQTSSTQLGRFLYNHLRKYPRKNEWRKYALSPDLLTEWLDEEDCLTYFRLLYILNLDVLVSVLGTHPEKLSWID